jgi:hypothetical protein
MTTNTTANDAGLREVREGERGMAIALYLDISNEQYIAFGEPGTIVAALDSSASRMVMAAVLDQGIRFDDDAARAISMLLTAGIDRQAFLADMLEVVAMQSRMGNDPMAGYAERVAALGTER